MLQKTVGIVQVFGMRPDRYFRNIEKKKSHMLREYMDAGRSRRVRNSKIFDLKIFNSWRVHKCIRHLPSPKMYMLLIVTGNAHNLNILYYYELLLFTTYTVARSE